ncbi:MAG: hypothetical protein NPINA01_05620 [Nitrospinaceae bacterium]|nr:MAG: hypothetical protein NPINA01_05620 [Nitrospinaceae bacterium]
MNIKVVTFVLVFVGASQIHPTPSASEEDMIPIFIGSSRQIPRLANQHLKDYMHMEFSKSKGAGEGELRTLNTRLNNLKLKLKNLKAVELMIPSKLYFDHEENEKKISRAAKNRMRKRELYCDPCLVSYERGIFYFEELYPNQDTSIKSFDTGVRQEPRITREGPDAKSESQLRPEQREMIQDMQDFLNDIEEMRSKN